MSRQWVKQFEPVWLTIKVWFKSKWLRQKTKRIQGLGIGQGPWVSEWTKGEEPILRQHTLLYSAAHCPQRSKCLCARTRKIKNNVKFTIWSVLHCLAVTVWIQVQCLAQKVGHVSTLDTGSSNNPTPTQSNGTSAKQWHFSGNIILKDCQWNLTDI